MIKYLLLSLLFIYNAFAYQQYGESGALLSPMDQTSRDTLTPKVPGVIIYNTDTEEYNYWNGILWNQIGSGGAGGAAVRNWYSANTISATNSTNNLAVPNFTVVEPGNLFNISECGTITNDAADGFSINVAKNSLIIVTLNSADIGATYTSGISINPTAAELDVSFSSLPPEKQGCKTETISNGSNSQSCTFSKMTRATDVLYVHTEPGLTYTNNPNFSIRVTCFADWSEAYPIAEWKTGTEYKANQLLNGGVDKNWILKVEQNHTSGDIDLDMNSGKLLALSPPIITTGLQNGGDATLAGNVATVQAGAGYIATYAGSVSPYPLIKSVEWTTQIVTLPATGIHTLMIDVNGLLFSIPGLGTTQQATENISVGIVDMNLGKVYDRETYPTNPVGQLQSLSLFLGAMTNGLNYTGSGLTLNRSQHSFYFWGTDSKDHYDPNVRIWPALSPLPFFEFTQTGPVAPVVLKTSVKTDVKDVGGTLVPMANNKWGFFRIYMSLGEEDYIMYSQADYPGEAEAIEAAVASSFIRPTSLDLSKFAGYVTYQKGDTNLADNKFVTCEPFGCDKIGSGGGGSGNVVGPASSVDSNLIAFDGITGKLIKDSGIPMANVVQGPATAVADSVATFNGTTGKLIKDSGILTSVLGDVKGPAVAVDSNVTAFDTTTGKLIKDSGIAVANLGDVKGPASAMVDNVATFDSTTGKLIKDSSISAANIVQGPAVAVNDNVAVYDGTTGKLIKDSALSKYEITKQQGNYLNNGDVEQGLVGYTGTAGIFTLNTTTPLEKLNSINFDGTALNDYVETSLVTIPPILMGQTCMIRVYVRGGDTNLQLQVVNGAGTIVGFKQLAVFTDSTPQFITFQCPTQALITATPALGQLKIKVTQSTATNSALATLDSFYLGQFESNTMVVSEGAQTYYLRVDGSDLDGPMPLGTPTSVTNDKTLFNYSGTTLTALKPIVINISSWSRTSLPASASIDNYITCTISGVARNASDGHLANGIGTSATGNLSPVSSATLVLNPGDTCSISSNSNLATTTSYAVNITATPLPQLATIVSMVKPMSPQLYYFAGTDMNGSFAFPAPTLSTNDKTLFNYSGTTLTILKPSMISIAINSYQPGGTSDSAKRIACTISGVARSIGTSDTNPQGAVITNTPSTTAPIPVSPGDTCNMTITRSLIPFTSYNVTITATHILDPNNDPNIMAVLPSQTQYLEQNLTLYVATTGSDSMGDGSAGKPFATPQAALNYLGRYTFAPGVEVLISVAAGQYILTSSIVPQHPQGAQITIQGANVAIPPVAADFCTPGTIPGRGWSNPTAAQRETCANTDLTMLRGKYPTELRFIRVAGIANDIDGIVVLGYTIKLDNLLITSNYLPNTNVNTASATGLSAGYRYYQANFYPGHIKAGQISVHGFKRHGIMAFLDSSIITTGATASNNGGDGINCQSSKISNNGTVISSNNLGFGVFVGFNASVGNSGTLTSINNGAAGVTASNNSIMANGPVTASNNGGMGVHAYGLSVITNNASVSINNNGDSGMSAFASFIYNNTTISSNNNLGHGIQSFNLSSIYIQSTATASNNGAAGFYANISGTINPNATATSSNNGGAGFLSSQGGYISIGGVVEATGNTGTGVEAFYGGITTFGSFVTVQSFNPAVGVVGNLESINIDR